MNEVERMRIELDALRKDVRKLQVLFGAKAVFFDDEREAQRVAEELGFEEEILLLPVQTGPRSSPAKKKLCRVAQHLHRKNKWPASRISRTLNCCERTVERWIAA